MMIIEIKTENFQEFLNRLKEAREVRKSGVCEGKKIDEDIKLLDFVRSRLSNLEVLMRDNTSYHEPFISDLEKLKKISVKGYEGMIWEKAYEHGLSHLIKWTGIKVEVDIPKQLDIRVEYNWRDQPTLYFESFIIDGYLEGGEKGLQKFKEMEFKAPNIEEKIERNEKLKIEIKEKRNEINRLTSEIISKREEREDLERYSAEVLEYMQSEDVIKKELKEYREAKEKLDQLKDEIITKEKESGSLEESVTKLKDSIRDLREEESSCNFAISKLETHITGKRKELDEIYKDQEILNEMGAPFLGVAEETIKNRSDILDKLNVRFEKEIMQKSLMMSLFWEICMTETYTSLIKEKIERTKQNIKDLDYGRMIKCLNEVEEIILPNLDQTDLIRKNVHDTADEEIIRKIIKDKTKNILVSYRLENENWLSGELKSIKMHLNKDERKFNYNIKNWFLKPVMDKINETSGSESLLMAMIGASLVKYIDEYGSHY